MHVIPHDLAEKLGGVEKIEQRVKKFREAMTNHGKTVGVAAPTEHKVIEILARSGDETFEVAAPEPVVERVLVPPPAPPPPVLEIPEFVPEPEPVVETVPLSFEELQKAKLRELTAFRREYQYNGIMHDKRPYRTDDRSIIDLLLHKDAGRDDPMYVVQWRVAPSQFVMLDVEAVAAILNKVRAHIQTGVNRESIGAKEIVSIQNYNELEALNVKKVWQGTR